MQKRISYRQRFTLNNIVHNANQSHIITIFNVLRNISKCNFFNNYRHTT